MHGAMKCLSIVIIIKLAVGYLDVMPQLPADVRSSFMIPDQSVIKFYPVTKKGGPMKRPLLPWNPQNNLDRSKFYFNVESDEFGFLYRLKLRKNTHLFSKTVLHGHISQEMDCLLSGQIVGDDKSSVGINLCSGKGSLLSSTDGEFLLEPSDKEQLYKHEWRLSMLKAPPDPSRVLEINDTEIVSDIVQRSKRSVSPKGLDAKRNIEILVVADHLMVKKYGTQEATTYILTVMNMVSSLFKDKSLGVNVNVVLAGLMFLKGDEEGLSIGHRADDTLNNFCQWQASLKDQIHHDHAILMTGLDICVSKNAPCDTIGYAPIRGMCSHTRSCTVNEDRGLGVAFTIAHEIGHNLGMIHDGVGNNCDEEGSIMGPSLTTNTGTFFWSRCNQKQLAGFLSSRQADCLLEDAPVKSAMYNMSISELPGQVYSGDQQCKHLYGHQATVCHFDLPDGADICRYLWCYVGGMRCETKFLPAAEGTPCDENKWCRRGECIPMNKNTPEPIDGGWADWTEWTTCTRSCGGGVRTRIRYCTNPSPRYGGKYCSGDSKEYGRCNMDDCEEDERAFRAQQCSHYNNEPFKGRYFKWAPVDNRYLSSMDKCKLFCRALRYNFFFQMNDKVIDGTRCDDDSNDICIAGKCQPVGCDGKIWSEAKADKCGVCNGDGTSCETIRGLFTGNVARNNYTTFLTIPAGSQNIHVKELRSSSSFIAVKSGSHYYLNGRWSMDWPGKFNFAGSKFVYNRLYSGLEMLYSSGPTNETLDIQILAVGVNPGVQYEYTIPLNVSAIRYAWEVSKSECNEECGGGYEEVTAACVGSDGRSVNDSLCSISNKPMVGLFKCNTAPCKPRWVPQEWSECSRTCGGGKQRRDVHCMQKFDVNDDRRVKNKFCRGNRPPKARACNREECLPQWRVGDWSECSVSCGRGIQRRSVYCVSTNRRRVVLSDSRCQHEAKPSLYRECITSQCATRWSLSEWSQCSVSCGLGGTQSRRLICVSQEKGDNFNKSVSTELCHAVPRPAEPMFRECIEEEYCPTWRTGAWSECSQTCGESERRRVVSCATHSGGPSDGCDMRDKPSELQRCHFADCPTTILIPSTRSSVTSSSTRSTTASTTTTTTTRSPTTHTTTQQPTVDASCTDSKSWCSSLKIYKYYCMRSYYSSVCCATCNT